MLNWLFGAPAPLKATPPTATIEYLLNDPLTPNLKEKIEVPFLTDTPRFFVQGWKGYAVSDIQKQAAQVYACMCNTMSMVKKVYARPIHWAATEALVVNPRAGRGLNAFYDRAALNFMFEEHPITKKLVFSCESVNVVAHELGHAILDALRPDFWNVQSLEVFAFHESFSDIISMLCTLQSDLVIDYVLKETNNNPRSSNVVSRIAEQMGNFMHALGKKNVEVDALRNAANNLMYVPPETLPKTTNNMSLSQEPHNFSRVFTGIWFDCLISLYENEVTQKPAHDTLKAARDMMAYITVNAMGMVAVNPRFYTAVAKSMLAVAQAKYGNACFSVLRKVFLKRKVISGVVMGGKFGKILDLRRADLNTIHALDNNMSGVRGGGVKETRLLDLSDRKLRMVNLPLELLRARLEIPLEQQYTIDATNRIVDELLVDEMYVKEAVRNAVNFLHTTGHVGSDNMSHDKCFCIKDGKLIRTRSCLDTRRGNDLE